MVPAMPSVPWHEFTQDPRSPQAAPLRASDRDRAVVQDVVTGAFADGRLTRDELDERSSAVERAKTLGELPALLADLVPVVAVPAQDEALRSQAVARFQAQRREALWAFLVPTLVCWAIWVATSIGMGHPYFPWPVFVTLGTGGNAARFLLHRGAMIEEEERRLERRLEERARHPRRHDHRRR